MTANPLSRILCALGAACSSAAPAAPATTTDERADAPLPLADASNEARLVADMADAARRFLSSLGPAQAARVRFALDDAERLNWHYVPKRRPGVAIGELSHAQRHLAYGFLSTALGRPGLIKATSIMALEEVLRRRGRGAHWRDAGAYHLTIFGDPSTKSTWGWRLEGHHLSLSLTLVGGTHAIAAPVFLGAAPTAVRTGFLADTRVLGREEELGFQLVASLDADSRRAAVHAATAPDDILWAPGTKASELPGLSAARMSPAQRRLVAALIDESIGNLPRELGDRERARLAAYGDDRIVFTWAGGTSPGQPHYFRISSPTFVYELDNTQEGATHVHSVWHVRDEAGGDFGAALLRDHYHQHPHGAGGKR